MAEHKAAINAIKEKGGIPANDQFLVDVVKSKFMEQPNGKMLNVGEITK